MTRVQVNISLNKITYKMAAETTYKLITKGLPPDINTVVASFKTKETLSVGDQIHLKHLTKWYKIENKVIVMTSDDAARATDVYLAVTQI